MYNNFVGMEIMRAKDPTDGQFHNSGYEHLKSIYLLKEAQAEAPLQAASAYILPLIALQKARLAIEAYLDQTGRKVDPAWDEINGKVTSTPERFAYVFGKMGKPFDFEAGIWREVLVLFEMTGQINENLSEMRKLPREKIPEKLKDIAVEYPIYRSQATAEEAIHLLLDLADLSSPLDMNSTMAK
jgi:hypothetical protein